MAGGRDRGAAVRFRRDFCRASAATSMRARDPDSRLGIEFDRRHNRECFDHSAFRGLPAPQYFRTAQVAGGSGCQEMSTLGARVLKADMLSANQRNQHQSKSAHQKPDEFRGEVML
jgi:hypothetical protein